MTNKNFVSRTIKKIINAQKRLPHIRWLVNYVRWFVNWTDPLYIARLSLYQAIKQKSHYAYGLLLDVGCGRKPYQNVFKGVRKYIGLDLPLNNKADVYGNGMYLPFKDRVFDTVLCNQVLEHVPEPFLLMKEIARVLKPGGFLILTTPQTWGLHLEPNNFYRYTKYGLSYLAEKSGLEIVEMSPTCGLWATVVQRISDTIVYTYASDWSETSIRVLSFILSPFLIIGYYLDKIFGSRGDTLDNIMIAKKQKN